MEVRLPNWIPRTREEGFWLTKEIQGTYLEPPLEMILPRIFTYKEQGQVQRKSPDGWLYLRGA